MKFNPEDEQNTGPRCRNCHRGSSGCGACHNENPAKGGVNGASDDMVVDNNRSSIGNLFAAMFAMIDYGNEGVPGAGTTYWNGVYSATQPFTNYKLGTISNQTTVNEVSDALRFIDKNGTDVVGQHKKSRSVEWTNTWRTIDGASADCGDDGFSWPHRTLGWKMLKDDLFGLDFDNNKWVGVGESRTYGSLTMKAHDLDSVCLDCHNPTIWNATSAAGEEGGHIDGPGTGDDYNDDVVMRGLP